MFRSGKVATKKLGRIPFTLDVSCPPPFLPAPSLLPFTRPRLLHAHGKMRSQAPKWQRLWSRRVGFGPGPGPALVVAHLKELTLTLSLVQWPHPSRASPPPPPSSGTPLSSPSALLLCYALPLSFGISFYSLLCLLNSLSHLSRQSQQWRLPPSLVSSPLLFVTASWQI